MDISGLLKSATFISLNGFGGASFAVCEKVSEVDIEGVNDNIQ